MIFTPFALMLCILILLGLHFIADWVCQSDHVAKNKSKDIFTLLYHVLLYTGVFAVAGAITAFVYRYEYHIELKLIFLAITFVTHLLTDYITSRRNSRLLQEGRTHDYYVTIGADQLIHTTTLILTFYYCFVGG